MTTSTFVQLPEERILFRTRPDPRWFAVAWKIFAGVVTAALATLFIDAILDAPTQAWLASFLPARISAGLCDVVYLGLVPLLVVLWVADDVARIYTSEIILTTGRLWVKGSPFSWSRAEQTLLEDIKSVNFRRDAIFIHLTTTRKVQVHLFPDGRQFVQAYEQHVRTQRQAGQ